MNMELAPLVESVRDRASNQPLPIAEPTTSDEEEGSGDLEEGGAGPRMNDGESSGMNDKGEDNRGKGQEEPKGVPEEKEKKKHMSKDLNLENAIPTFRIFFNKRRNICAIFIWLLFIIVPLTFTVAKRYVFPNTMGYKIPIYVFWQTPRERQAIVLQQNECMGCTMWRFCPAIRNVYPHRVQVYAWNNFRTWQELQQQVQAEMHENSTVTLLLNILPSGDAKDPAGPRGIPEIEYNHWKEEGSFCGCCGFKCIKQCGTCFLQDDSLPGKGMFSSLPSFPSLGSGDTSGTDGTGTEVAAPGTLPGGRTRIDLGIMEPQFQKEEKDIERWQAGSFTAIEKGVLAVFQTQMGWPGLIDVGAVGGPSSTWNSSMREYITIEMVWNRFLANRQHEWKWMMVFASVSGTG